MSETDRVDFYLAAASQVIAHTRYWLATPGEAGAVNARPRGRAPQERGDPWLFRFVTDGRSRKVGEIGRNSRVTLIVQRDPKGLYKRALADEIKNFTGVDQPYDAPEAPELRLDTAKVCAEASADEVVALLERQGLIARL